MHKKHNKKILAIIFILALTFGLYAHFHSDPIIEAATSNDEDSLSSSLDTNNTATKTDSTSAVNDDTSFLVKLNSLKTIRIDTSIFSDKAFNSLVDNNIKLDAVPYGRINPFSPVSNTTVAPNTTKPTILGEVKALKTN